MGGRGRVGKRIRRMEWTSIELSDYEADWPRRDETAASLLLTATRDDERAPVILGSLPFTPSLHQSIALSLFLSLL
jgi:hypothetical protein